MASGTKIDRGLIWKVSLAAALVILFVALPWFGQGFRGGGSAGDAHREPSEPVEWGASSFDYANVPDYGEMVAAADGDDVPSMATLNGDVPFFSEGDFSRGDFVELSELDDAYEADGNLGRVGSAFAMVGPRTVTGEKRGPLRLRKQPSGWIQGDYRGEVAGGYLYNRCHLLAWSLTGRAIALDDVRNLMTGTRFFNVKGMASCERDVFDYVGRTGNRVLCRVTPVFLGHDLLARGVLVEAASVEDRDGAGGLRMCRWCYNVQAGVEIDYATGENRLSGETRAPGGG